jgi:hypothetical protein
MSDAKKKLDTAIDRSKETIYKFRDFFKEEVGSNEDKALAGIQYLMIIARLAGIPRDELLKIVTLALARAYEAKDPDDPKAKTAPTYGPN